MDYQLWESSRQKMHLISNILFSCSVLDYIHCLLIHRLILTLDQVTIIRKNTSGNKITHCKAKQERFGDFVRHTISKCYWRVALGTVYSLRWGWTFSKPTQENKQLFSQYRPRSGPPEASLRSGTEERVEGGLGKLRRFSPHLWIQTGVQRACVELFPLPLSWDTVSTGSCRMWILMWLERRETRQCSCSHG